MLFTNAVNGRSLSELPFQLMLPVTQNVTRDRELEQKGLKGGSPESLTKLFYFLQLFGERRESLFFLPPSPPAVVRSPPTSIKS